MPSLFHINLPLSPFSFLSSKSCPVTSESCSFSPQPLIPSSQLGPKSWSVSSWPTVTQVTPNLSILEQLEISEAPCHFTAKDTEVQQDELDLPQIMGQVSACDFLNFYYYSKRREYWFWHKFYSIDRYLLSNYSAQQWARHRDSRNKLQGSEFLRSSGSRVGSEHTCIYRLRGKAMVGQECWKERLTLQWMAWGRKAQEMHSFCFVLF